MPLWPPRDSRREPHREDYGREQYFDREKAPYREPYGQDYGYFDRAAYGRDFYRQQPTRSAYPDWAPDATGATLQEALAFHKQQMERHREAALQMERHCRQMTGGHMRSPYDA